MLVRDTPGKLRSERGEAVDRTDRPSWFSRLGSVGKLPFALPFPPIMGQLSVAPHGPGSPSIPPCRPSRCMHIPLSLPTSAYMRGEARTAGGGHARHHNGQPALASAASTGYRVGRVVEATYLGVPSPSQIGRDRPRGRRGEDWTTTGVRPWPAIGDGSGRAEGSIGRPLVAHLSTTPIVR